MINLSAIGHVLLRVTDEEASKRFYRDVLGFRIAEQDSVHGGVFMTLGDGFHTIDIVQHPTPQDTPRPSHRQRPSRSRSGPSAEPSRRLGSRAIARRPKAASPLMKLNSKILRGRISWPPVRSSRRALGEPLRGPGYASAWRGAARRARCRAEP